MNGLCSARTARNRFWLLRHQGFGRLEANHLIMTDADLIAPGAEVLLRTTLRHKQYPLMYGI